MSAQYSMEETRCSCHFTSVFTCAYPYRMMEHGRWSRKRLGSSIVFLPYQPTWGDPGEVAPQLVLPSAGGPQGANLISLEIIDNQTRNVQLPGLFDP